jgi:hypothetical protein
LLHSKYEGTAFKKLALDIGFHLWIRLTRENWRAKLVSLLLAITGWYLTYSFLRKSLGTGFAAFWSPARISASRFEVKRHWTR